MNENNLQEVWQVDVGGQIYETRFDEMTQWIFEGSLLPQDLVKRGQLRWIEARKVPSLIPFFNAKEKNLPPPVVTTSTNPRQAEEFAVQTQNFQNAPPIQVGQSSEFTNSAATFGKMNHGVVLPPAIPQISDNCCIHDADAAFYLCETCGNSFCKLCVKSYGGNVKICPMCGAMCVSRKDLEAVSKAVLPAFANESFGFGDFGRAIGHPFKFMTSLILGAFMFSLFTIGQSAAGFGGIFMLAAALFCFMLANMMTFGVLKNTIENFSQGKLDVNFMPSFDDFSILDDVLHPFFLSIGAYLVSFGLFIVIIVGAVWYTITSINEQMKPNGPMMMQPFNQNDQSSLKQVDKFNEFAGDMNERNKSLNPNNPNNPPGYVDTEDTVKEADEMIKQHRKAQLESTFGKTPETIEAEQRAMISSLVSKALPIVLLAIVALLWGLFYFPAACAVAGYTQSFMSTINPLVGLDTIKTLGFDYVKILFMGLILLIVSGIASFIFAIIFLPFNLPNMGNIPAKFASGFVTFYVSAVFSCILGYAIFKNADKFRIARS